MQAAAIYELPSVQIPFAVTLASSEADGSHV